MKLTRNCTVCWETEETSVLKRAWKRMERDMKNVLLPVDEREYAATRVVVKAHKGDAETYTIHVDKEEIIISGTDELGMIYALLFISEKNLGVTPFWFWNDQRFVPREFVEIPEGDYKSPVYTVRFRGWFINDEVLLDAWGKEHFNNEKQYYENDAWEMAMEALLRLGGNMVIPGTDYNSHKYRKLATEMGLWITHHHAEPLGAKMFARTYPELTPSYAEYPQQFHELWREAIEEQKNNKVIWNLGFRGQGDKPFWDDDPTYDTPEKRGKLISELILAQYKEVASSVQNPVCCTNLYGEVMELYQQGYLSLPDNIICIWADNGYGKMVSRRQGNHNPRVPALPENPKGRHGIYYHASFYDLQAASHITMLPNSPEFVERELNKVLAKGVNEFWLINCSNVKPHTYMLDRMARMWGKQMPEYEVLYFRNECNRVKELYRDYFKAMLSYGNREDEHTGEQFYHYTLRDICYWWVSGKSDLCENLRWLTGEKKDFSEQITYIEEILEKGIDGLMNYYLKCKKAASQMQSRLLSDSLVLQAAIHYYSAKALLRVCRTYTIYQEGKYEKAFRFIGEAIEDIQRALEEMKAAEHGKWKGFYENDCLTDVKFSKDSLKRLMGYFRVLGDGPDYYHWALKYCYKESDDRVVLITNMRNHPTDMELYHKMKEKQKIISNGIPWFDQDGRTVNAHGGCIVCKNNTYYLFGEYKTNDKNQFDGFSCYETKDFKHWNFRGISLKVQEEGLLGPGRIGERVKVLKCPETDQYVMFMHTDDLKYNDPCIAYATSEKIDGEFKFAGPLLFHGEPIRMWDIGSFVDDDGTGYLLTHEGNIYRLSSDYRSVEELVAENIAPGGESPALLKRNGYYFMLLSQKTCWERNDNYYLTAKKLNGPWVKMGNFCPKGSLTYNTQTSFVFEYDDENGNKIPIYLGDRWSYPRQADAATLVLLPIESKEDKIHINKYMEQWSPDNLEDYSQEPEKLLAFVSNDPKEKMEIQFTGCGIVLFGERNKDGGYADIELIRDGLVIHKVKIDLYSLVQSEGECYRSPSLEMGTYTMRITVTGEGSVCYDKNGTRFGSEDCLVRITGYRIEKNKDY